MYIDADSFRAGFMAGGVTVLAFALIVVVIFMFLYKKKHI